MTDVQSLFLNGTTGLSQQSVDTLVQNLDGQTRLGCVGAQVDDLNTDDVVLVVALLDQSGSMGHLSDTVIDSFNEMTRALADSKSADSILLSTWVFDNDPKLLFGYTPIDKVTDLDDTMYTPTGATALYDAVVDGFTGLVGYGQDLRDAGIRTRCIVLVISDGYDNVSAKSAAAVKAVADDLLKQEFYTLAFVGFGDEADFRQVADNIGFPSVLTAANTPSDIRQTLNMVSASIIRTSQTQIAAAGNSFFTI